MALEQTINAVSKLKVVLLAFSETCSSTTIVSDIPWVGRNQNVSKEHVLHWKGGTTRSISQRIICNQSHKRRSWRPCSLAVLHTSYEWSLRCFWSVGVFDQGRRAYEKRKFQLTRGAHTWPFYAYPQAVSQVHRESTKQGQPVWLRYNDVPPRQGKYGNWQEIQGKKGRPQGRCASKTQPVKTRNNFGPTMNRQIPGLLRD